MRHTALCTIAVLCAFGVAPAQAQPTRVFVAAQGLDSNPCTFVAPCRSFQKAHDTVAAGGEIDVLDPAGYGAVTISKAISIQGHGFAGITITGIGNSAITVAAPSGAHVSMRGLLIDGVGSGQRGILFNSGASLDLQDSVIRRVVGNAIEVGFGSSGTSALFVSNCRFAVNGASAVSVLGTGSYSGFIDRIVANKGGAGLTLFPNAAQTRFTVSDSVITNHSGDGVFVNGTGGPAAVMLKNVVVSNNLVGVDTGGSNAVIRVTKSTITGNGQGLRIGSSGQIVSYADNYINGNTSSDPPSSTISLQ